ncbi:MAG TPA: hypothetical protein VNK26_04285 [Pyrinomonadaceae bacterium]|nr:hypothetical protein [Pyrinomonadaceae bacterium]
MRPLQGRINLGRTDNRTFHVRLRYLSPAAKSDSFTFGEVTFRLRRREIVSRPATIPFACGEEK